MTRRKFEITAHMNERDFPHIVELALPPGGFRSQSLEFDAFHHERALIRRISARSSPSIFGRPPRERDFHRQYRRKPARCQRTRVSGRTIVMALRTDGNHRYSVTKNKRSPFVSCAPNPFVLHASRFAIDCLKKS